MIFVQSYCDNFCNNFFQILTLCFYFISLLSWFSCQYIFFIINLWLFHKLYNKLLFKYHTSLLKIKEKHLKAQEMLKRCPKITRMFLEDITPWNSQIQQGCQRALKGISNLEHQYNHYKTPFEQIAKNYLGIELKETP